MNTARPLGIFLFQPYKKGFLSETFFISQNILLQNFLILRTDDFIRQIKGCDNIEHIGRFAYFLLLDKPEMV